MQISKDKVVSFHYRLTDEAGKETESSHTGEPMVYMHGHKGIMIGLEDAMKGKAEGDKFNVTVAPRDAYGARKENAQQRVPIKHLVDRPKRLKPGMAVKINTKEGARDAIIVKVGKFNVDVDTNHPLAGQHVTFDVEVLEVREATALELAHGHAHGADGHAH